MEIIFKLMESAHKLTKEQCQTLIALHQTLLSEHHNLVHATQHPKAPPRLRSLPSRFAIHTRLLRRNIYPVLEFLRRQADDAPEGMSAMLETTFGMLNRLVQECPPQSPLSKDWDMISRNLHLCVCALRRADIAVPETEAELQSRCVWLTKLDEDDVECVQRLGAFFESWQDEDEEPLEIEPWRHGDGDFQEPPFIDIGDDDDDDDDPEQQQETAAAAAATNIRKHLPSLDSQQGSLFWTLMAAWHQLGRRMIARSPREFWKFFTFLPWATISMFC